jgi:hypothetical protein
VVTHSVLMFDDDVEVCERQCEREREIMSEIV